MKKIMGMLWLGLLLWSSTSLSPAVAVSAVVSSKATSVALTLSPLPTPARVEYTLPFPGILPTHPLYVFKNLRDRIIEFLIIDPINKAEFYVLQADKKLNMGVTLNSMGKTAQSRSAFADAFVSRYQAVTLLEGHGRSGALTPGYLTEKLVLSLIKHKEVLMGMGEQTEAVDAMIARAQLLPDSTSK